MSVEIDERLKDEIEALEAILMDDVTVLNNEQGIPQCIKTVVFPSTADDTNQQYVCLTLEVTLTTRYPDVEPEIKLRNPRGLDDCVIDQINREVREKCVQCLGQPVIFELIELIRECLTNCNMPSCQCAVCLYGFKRGDHFTKTQCYHYFHSHCLACHLVSTERLYREEQEKLPAWQRSHEQFQPLCPVCREPISCDLESLKTAAPPLEVENAHQFEMTAELKALQARMASLYLYQQSRGGIIDIEAEESKLLLVTADSSQDDEQTSDSTSETPPSTSINQTTGNSAAPHIQTRSATASSGGGGGGGGHHHRGHRGFDRNSRRSRGKNSRPASAR